MATNGRGSRRRSRVIDIDQFSVSRVGNSKAIFCFKQLNKYDFPSEVGAPINVLYREEGPDGEPEVVLKPAKNDE
jgi:hypothetical protein